MLFQLGCSASEAVSEVVDDGVTEPGDDPAESTTTLQGAVEPEDSVFAPARVLNVQVSISDENWNQLRFEHRKPVDFFGEGCREPIPDAFNYYPADVTVDGTSLGGVGVRTKEAYRLYQSGPAVLEGKTPGISGRAPLSGPKALRSITKPVTPHGSPPVWPFISFVRWEITCIAL